MIPNNLDRSGREIGTVEVRTEPEVWGATISHWGFATTTGPLDLVTSTGQTSLSLVSDGRSLMTTVHSALRDWFLVPPDRAPLFTPLFTLARARAGRQTPDGDQSYWDLLFSRQIQPQDLRVLVLSARI
ncbi:hypothetical protein RRG08_017673 [Elysia crispata]|uniref:Uncharacterized protein n=1 Tax=Elysia crispata TaxID=231223 RepID=A0AAE1DDA3_9GAST|nr:hypothetical protein RRG08_017673 [Elysia crispata]